MQLKNDLIKESLDHAEMARKIRLKTLDIIYEAKTPHIGSCFSIIEILVSLYFKYLNIDETDFNARDRFVLSKGHSCAALYAVLAEKGLLDEKILKGFCRNGGTLEGHPSHDLSKFIEVSTGSLGHGLSIACGMAKAAKYDKLPSRVFTLMSDGEVQSGFVWEAALFASHHCLDNLTAIIDYNKIQALGNVKDINDLEPLKDKWTSFGWDVKEVDGHSFHEIFTALDVINTGNQRPRMIVAHTVKGKGVSFMENDLLWHYRCPDEEEYRRALEELSL